MIKNPIKLLWLLIGCISLALGTIGIAIPILPTVPFYMLTVFAFAKSSERLHNWFIGTKLYKKHLEGFVKRKAMPIKTKVTIMAMVSAVMLFGFIMMKDVLVGRICLVIVWLFHIYFLFFRIKSSKD